MKIISNRVSVRELRETSQGMIDNTVKAVVDVEKGIMAVDGLHADEEALLIQHGSARKNLWGINIYLDLTEDGFVGFDSAINCRPSLGNRSRNVDDRKIQREIIKIVNGLIEK